MHERSQKILEATVQEFIRSGEPVSSGVLFDRYDFGIRPAMIRFELNDLTDAGYLEQPHTSGGRIPTDRGYEFFAARALERDIAPRAVHRDLFAAFFDGAWEEALDRFSRTLGTLTVLEEYPKRVIIKTGLEELIDHLDWDSHVTIKSIIHDFEELENRLPNATDFDEKEIEIFIGRKSPFTKSNELSAIASSYTVRGSKVFLCAIGPKRMNYEKAADMFKGLKEIKNEKVKIKK